MFNKISKILFCTVFVLMLTVPLLNTNLKPNVVSEVENRTLAPIPQLYDQEGNKNEAFIADFESWFNDNIGYREQMFRTNSKMQYHIFNNSPNDKVVIGQDGWLFYTGENNFKIASGEYPDFDEAVLEQICQEQIRVQQKLAEQGIEYVIILPPSKVSIYPEYIRGDFSIRRTPVDELADYLEAHSDIKVVRLKETLLAAKEGGEGLLYFKTDTHWNAYGSYVGYSKIIEDLNTWGVIESAPVEVEFNEYASVRDLSLVIGNIEKQYAEYSAVKHIIADAAAISVKEGETYDSIQNYVQETGIRRGDYYQNSNDDLPVFLLFGDSMILDCMEPLLAENCSELVCIWHYSVNQEVIDTVQPDIVFLELSERNLNVLPGAEKNFID